MIGNSEYLTYSIWYELFLSAQGYPMKSNILWQDNEAAEKIARNRNMSCSSKSKHIRIRFFWEADRVKQEKISVKYCSTIKMLVDLFTKPLQGSKFNFSEGQLYDGMM